MRNCTNCYRVMVFLYLGEWTSMEEYTMMIPRDTLDGAFYRAVFNIHNAYFNKAQSVSRYFAGIFKISKEV